MIHAGIAQTGERRESRTGPLSEVEGATPSPRSKILQAFVAGLQVDPEARATGYRDGARGAPGCPPAGIDPFSYFTGFVEGQRYGRDRPVPWLRCNKPSCGVSNACVDPKSCAAERS